MTYKGDDVVPCFTSWLLTKGYNPTVKSCTRLVTQEGTPDDESVSFTSSLRALLIALLTSLRTIRLSIVNAATSIACSCSALCGAGAGAGVVWAEDLPKSEAKEDERREELAWVGARCPGRGGSGGLTTTCGGRGRVLV